MRNSTPRTAQIDFSTETKSSQQTLAADRLGTLEVKNGRGIRLPRRLVIDRRAATKSNR